MYGEPPYIVKCVNNNPIEIINENNEDYIKWLEDGNEVTEWIEENGN